MNTNKFKLKWKLMCYQCCFMFSFILVILLLTEQTNLCREKSAITGNWLPLTLEFHLTLSFCFYKLNSLLYTGCGRFVTNKDITITLYFNEVALKERNILDTYHQWLLKLWFWHAWIVFQQRVPLSSDFVMCYLSQFVNSVTQQG